MGTPGTDSAAVGSRSAWLAAIITGLVPGGVSGELHDTPDRLDVTASFDWPAIRRSMSPWMTTAPSSCTGARSRPAGRSPRRSAGITRDESWSGSRVRASTAPARCSAPPGTVASGATPEDLVAQMDDIRRATSRPKRPPRA
jgi:hypothetical protein